MALRNEWVSVSLPWIWVLVAGTAMQGRTAESDRRTDRTWFSIGATAGSCIIPGLISHSPITDLAEWKSVCVCEGDIAWFNMVERQ